MENHEQAFVDAENVLTAQAHLLDGTTSTQVAYLFRALSDPTRVRIISALSHTELCVQDLATTLGMTQSAVSHQLRSLRDMHVVRFRKVGRHVYYELDDEHVFELYKGGVEHIRHSGQSQI